MNPDGDGYDEETVQDARVQVAAYPAELARTMHKFFTVAPKPSALTALRSLGLLDVPYSTPAVTSVPPCQDGIFDASLQKPMHSPS